MFKKIVAYILVFATVISFSVVPAFAAAAGYESLIVDSNSLSAWDDWLDRNIVVGEIGLIDCKSACWVLIDRCFSSSGCGSVPSVEKLSDSASLWNTRMAAPGNWGSLAVYCVIQGFDSSVPTAEVAYDSDLGVYRLREYWSGLWLVNSSGHFPYYRPETVDDTTGTEPIRTGQWLPQSKFVGTDFDHWNVINKHDLYVLRDQWLEEDSSVRIAVGSGYQWILRTDSNTTYVLCDEYGYPYCLPNDKETAVTTPNNYYQDTTNQYIDDNSVHVNVQDGGSALVGSPVDVNNGIINVGGQVQYIDQLIYDASTQTYYVDAHDEYVYDIELNQYVTNNYSYEIQYHIDHTSITYIGQTEEYDERYEMYFQLPDGRSSADLTAEDLEQLSTVFADVIPYVRTADNLDQRALYHFDGNTEDDSYWSYCSSFDWFAGASLTYMDEGTFGGSLYLDETEHDFTITLPNNDAAANWTLQFRYYQSHTPAPVADSFIDVGGHVVLMFTGSEYQTASGSVLAATSVGSWNEICIMRSSNALYYYLNGVFLYSVSDAVYHGNYINFHFGSNQQTYKKLDELRFTSSTVYSPGLDYTPSAVPFDSNLTLVLPDSGTLEEQGIGLVPAENNLLADVGLDDWTSLGVVDSLYSNMDAFAYANLSNKYERLDLNGGPYITYNPNYLSFGDGDLGVSVNARIEWYAVSTEDELGQKHQSPGSVMYMPVTHCVGSSLTCDGSTYGFEFGVTYCWSVVLADGSYSYISFTPNEGKSQSASVSSAANNNSTVQLHGCIFGCNSSTATEDAFCTYGVGFVLRPSSSPEIIYMELVEGTRPQFQFSRLYSDSVAPDPGEVIPDEYVQLSKPASGNLLDGYDLSDWTADNFSYQYFAGEHVSDVKYGVAGSAFATSSLAVFDTDFVSISPGDVGMVVNFGGHDPYSTCDSSCDYYCYNLRNALFFPVSYKGGSSSKVSLFGTTEGKTYTLSVVLADGTSSSITFSYGSGGYMTCVSTHIDSVIKLSTGQGYIGCADYYYNNGIYIYSDVVTSAEIVYMELAEGTESLFSCSRVASVYSADSLANSPVLAVRTNREITGYQIGGVRPSYPSTGLVYAMVENSRIISLQQYTGYAWEAVDGRIWTGERWIPYSSFDVFTLKDFYDVIGSSDPEYEYIYTETGFWAWFQRAWLVLMEKIDQILSYLERIVTGVGAPDEETNNKINVIIDQNGADRISLDDVSLIGTILDKIESFFNTGYKVDDMFSFFDGLGSESWFSSEISSGLDEVNGAAPVGDDDPYNMHYYYDQIDAIKGERGEGK